MHVLSSHHQYILSLESESHGSVKQMSSFTSIFVHFFVRTPQPREQQTTRRRRPSVFREKSDADLPFLAVKYSHNLKNKPIRQMNPQGKMVIVDPSETTRFIPNGDANAIDIE